MSARFKSFAALSICLLPIALSGQTSYANKVYGISFEFPKAYKLHSGGLADGYSLGYLGPIPMEFAAPGGVRLATIEVPANLYPNTDLNAAFVTVSVNEYLTRQECDSLATDRPESQKPLTIKIDSLEFRGASEGNAGLGHQFEGSYYHSFVAGTCYELGEGISTSGYGSVDCLQMVDAKQVSASLDRILQSIRIVAVPDIKIESSPSIRSFVAAPQNPQASTYRVSWDVTGTGTGGVWLSIGCSGDLSIFEIPFVAPEGHSLLCDVLRPAQSSHGSLDFEFRNLSGGDVQETVRIFAKSHGAVSKTLTVSLPPLPVIVSVARYGAYAGPPMGRFISLPDTKSRFPEWPSCPTRIYISAQVPFSSRALTAKMLCSQSPTPYRWDNTQCTLRMIVGAVMSSQSRS
jgi:hypothetical protein